MGTRATELTNFHLRRGQKRALKERAKAKGTNVAEEIRNAIDAYLGRVTPEALELLDVATKQAERTIGEMTEMLDATNRRADLIFSELERLRGGLAPELADKISIPPPRKPKGAAH